MSDYYWLKFWLRRVLFAIAVVTACIAVASLIVTYAQDPFTQCACWTGDADTALTDTYRLYWSKFPVAWYGSQSALLVIEPTCVAPSDMQAPVVCAEWRHLVPDPSPGQLFFILVTSSNEHGSVGTEHGCVN